MEAVDDKKTTLSGISTKSILYDKDAYKGELISLSKEMAERYFRVAL